MDSAQLGRPELLARLACQERIIIALKRAHMMAVCEKIQAENRAKQAEINCRERMRRAGVKFPGRPPKKNSATIPLDSGISAR